MTDFDPRARWQKFGTIMAVICVIVALVSGGFIALDLGGSKKAPVVIQPAPGAAPVKPACKFNCG
jgi:hypothetical protein